MRTLIFLVGGVVLWGVFIAIARLFFAASASATMTATILFGAVWFVIAAVNMWIGMSQGGYSFWEELPIFLLIFLLPTLSAFVARWKLL
jgi:hypothetical protein